VQEIIVVTYCDYPGCANEFKEREQTAISYGQETVRTTVWVYVHAKGRKTEPVEVLLCDKHVNELRGIFQALQKYSLKDQS
jgi:hypothetical protein